MSKLKDLFRTKYTVLSDEIKQIVKNHGDKVIDTVTISQIYGGMRDIKALATETSLLDPINGIRFRGFSIDELKEKLPKVKDEPLPEGIFYLMLTGEIPTKEDVAELTNEFAKRNYIPKYVYVAIDALPSNTHPMTQFIIGITALQNESIFAKKYREGINKKEYWEFVYEDSLNLIAKLPVLAAYIYRRTYKCCNTIAPDPSLDWSANFAHMLGFDSEEFYELMRLYLTIHSDHEGGNVSAHTNHLVASALSDPYLSFAASMAGLAGPLHGLANQEVLRWIINFKEKVGDNATAKDVEAALWDTLNSGQVIPGYGHAVLRRTDPRYTAQREFALKHLPDNELFKIVSLIFEVAPGVLTKHGKTKNPYPNVDAHSGVLLVHYGMKEYDFYTVLFGVSRALGVLASAIWDRALGYAIERPKSLTTEDINEFIKREQHKQP